MSGDPRADWHRDGMPAWAWTALVLARVAQVAAALAPLALAVLLWWTWTHRHDPGVRRLLGGAARWAAAVLDSTRSVSR